MIRTLLLLIAVAAPAAAQVAPLSFDSGKLLPITPGQWTYAATATGSEARYGNLSIRCERAARTVAITRTDAPNLALTIATSSETRTIPAGGRLLANDTLFDAIAFSRGRFLVSGGSGPVLAIPNWPEAAKAVEDCRN